MNETLDDQYFDRIIMYFTNHAANTTEPLNCFNTIRKTFPLVMEELFVPPHGELMAFWMAVQLWNVFPHPDNDFKPIKFEIPKRNQQCLCGSGKKFKQCCINVPVVDNYSAEMFWPYLVEMLSHKYLVDSAKQYYLPVEGLRVAAQMYLENETPKKAIDLLAPSFVDKGKHLTKQHTGLTDLLCDAFDEHYQTDKKKIALLDSLKHHSVKWIRCEAWQRIASIYADKGEHKKALEALYEAMKADPHDTSHAILEIQLLVGNQEIEKAKQRATFWYAKISKYPDAFERLGGFLETAKSDPIAALSQLLRDRFNDPRLEGLEKWLENNHQSIKVPKYRIESMGVDEESGYEDLMLLSPKSFNKLLQLWEDDLSPCSKPFSTQPVAEVDTWYHPYDTDWVEFLFEHPESVHNISLLDDLINCLCDHPGNTLPISPALELAKKLANHAMDLLSPILIKIQQNKKQRLTWLVSDNRPILRIIANAIFLEEPKSKQALTLINAYIEINPGDNHGFRAIIMNHWIDEQDYSSAIELASRYPEDRLVEIMMGKLLAEFAKGNLETASDYLISSLRYHPFVIPYLTKARIAKPAMHDFGVSMGGKDEAWIYREEMREVWLTVPGALDWLKKQHKLIDYKK